MGALPVLGSLLSLWSLRGSLGWPGIMEVAGFVHFQPRAEQAPYACAETGTWLFVSPIQSSGTPWCQSASDGPLGDGEREGKASGRWIILSQAMDFVFFGPFLVIFFLQYMQYIFLPKFVGLGLQKSAWIP